MKAALPALALALAMAPGIAQAADCPSGLFRADAGPDTAAGLEISPNGRFRYMLSEGAVDEEAEGHWRCDKGTLLLTTEPTPRPAEFQLDRIEERKDGAFSLIVSWPNGRGAEGIDFNLVMDSGDAIADYTQADGWTRDLGARTPKSVQLSEPFYGTVSPVIPLPPRHGLTVRIRLIPNDMGKAAFKDTPVTQENGRLLLHWRGGALPFRMGAD